MLRAAPQWAPLRRTEFVHPAKRCLHKTKVLLAVSFSKTISRQRSIGTITLETALVWLDKYPLCCNIVIGPGSIPWEIGNAFSAMFKRNRLGIEEAKRGLEIFKSIPLRYIEPDFINAVSISKQTNMYAYDAYFLDCALRQKAPILTLDSKLKETAKKLKIKTLEA